jgi:hypothetical protein
MSCKISVYASALLLGTALTVGAFAQQESPAENRQEQRADQLARQNAGHEPHMSAALTHLRQAEEELEKAAPNKGGHREKAMELTKQAQSQVEEGIQFYNQHPPQAKNTPPKPKK